MPILPKRSESTPEENAPNIAPINIADVSKVVSKSLRWRNAFIGALATDIVAIL
jgi:hypothetical protein